TVTYADDLSGVAAATALNPVNYGLFTPNGLSNRPIPLSGLTAGAGVPGGPLSVVAQFNGGRSLGRGNYVLSINSNGVTDVAGNILDERLYTPFPSVSRRPGQPYVAEFLTDGTAVQGPRQYV